MADKKDTRGTAFAYGCKFTQYESGTKVKKNKDGTISLVPPKKKQKK